MVDHNKSLIMVKLIKKLYKPKRYFKATCRESAEFKLADKSIQAGK